MKKMWNIIPIAGLLLIVLSGCVSQAWLDRSERDRLFRDLSSKQRAAIVARSCGENVDTLSTFSRTSCTLYDSHLSTAPPRCWITSIGPVMSKQELYQDTKSTVVATCRKLSDIALRARVTHQAWCASFVPGLLPQGVTLDQAKERAVTCYASTLRREGDSAAARRTKCCEDRKRIGSKGVWKCLNDEADRLDLTHADDACKAALGGVQSYSAAVWCGICADPEAFVGQLSAEPTEKEPAKETPR